jgi:LysM repeat protein
MRTAWKNTLCLLVFVGLLVSACAPGVASQPPQGTATPASEGTLRPYPSDTPTVTPLPTGYVSPTPSPTITPTPTDVYYEVQLNDDMYSIAFRYGLSPAEVMTANPDVDPRAMIVGMTLLIPITPTPPPTATPTMDGAQATAAPTEAGEAAAPPPDCYLDATGGMWCFALVENDQDSPLENVSGVITLGEGETARQETAITPLNLLPAGAALPLIAYFQPPLPADRTASVEQNFSLPVMPDDQRYLSLTLDEQPLDLSEGGLAATASGTVSLSADQADAEYVWISATAFDAAGHIVAVRRWDSTLELVAGGTLDFEIMLYSMGGPIDHVDLLAEAQPVNANTTP